MANLKKLLGARIKEIRNARKMTQEKFAELIDINPSNISKIEKVLMQNQFDFKN